MAELPHWQPLNGVPSTTDGGESGRVIVLVASEGAATAGWGPGAAIALARSWSEEGRRVMLVDGGLDQPTLHTAVGLRNAEGLTDATIYGASVPRVSRSVEGEDFFLITSGTAIADPHEVVRSGRWYRLSAGMIEAGVTLVLYIRDGQPAGAAFLGSASDIVVLADEGEAPPEAVRDLEPLVRAVTGASRSDVAGGAIHPTDEFAAGASAQEDAYAATPGLAPVLDGGPGSGRMILLVVVAIAAAAALGYVFWSGLG